MRNAECGMRSMKAMRTTRFMVQLTSTSSSRLPQRGYGPKGWGPATVRAVADRARSPGAATAHQAAVVDQPPPSSRSQLKSKPGEAGRGIGRHGSVEDQDNVRPQDVFPGRCPE